MRGFWGYPALPVGVALIVLGLGNWGVSQSKILEYSQRAAAPQLAEAQAPLSDFRRLSPRTNARVLEGLHRGPGAAGVAQAKRDFYAVVESGGRLITILGILLVGIGLAQHWRQRRLPPRSESGRL